MRYARSEVSAPETKIGHTVRFEYEDERGKKRIKKGFVVDETVGERLKGTKADYFTRVQLIQFDNNQNKHIRFAYWKKRADSDTWNWANRPWVFDKDITKRAIEEAERKGLFR